MRLSGEPLNSSPPVKVYSMAWSACCRHDDAAGGLLALARAPPHLRGTRASSTARTRLEG